MKMIVLLQMINQNKLNTNLTKTAENPYENHNKNRQETMQKTWMKFIHKLKENQTKIKYENRFSSKKKNSLNSKKKNCTFFRFYNIVGILLAAKQMS